MQQTETNLLRRRTLDGYWAWTAIKEMGGYEEEEKIKGEEKKGMGVMRGAEGSN